MRKTFRILNFSFSVEIANPKTLWYFNHPRKMIRGEEHVQERVDSLVCLERVFFREYSRYGYCFKIGRIRILMVNRSRFKNGYRIG